jgi:hypothetical protein
MASAVLVSLSTIGSSMGMAPVAPDLGGTSGGGDQGPQQQQQSSPSPSPSSVPSGSPSPEPSSVSERTLYLGNLIPVNGSSVSGRVGVVVDGGSVGFSVQASGLAPSQSHPQYLSSDNSCFNYSGGDGQNPAQVSPPNSSQDFFMSLPSGSFPLSSRSGNLTYIQSFPESSVTSTITSSSSSDLNGKVVEIMSENSTPLACGKLYRSPE